MNQFKNEKEYYQRLMDWGKQWIALYSRMTVRTAEDGEIVRIRGSLLFSYELEEIRDPAFTDIEKKEYEYQTKKMLLEMEQIHMKGRNTMALEHLYQIYGYSQFEWFMVVMAFLPELDQQFQRVFVLLQDDYEKKEPTVAFCIQMFTLREEDKMEYRQQVAMRWDLLSTVFSGWAEKEALEAGPDGISSMPLKLDGRIIRFLLDRQSEDFYFKGTVGLHPPHKPLAPMMIREGLVKKLAHMFQEASAKFIYISGAKGVGKKFLVSHYCKRQGKNLLLVDVPGLLAEIPAGRRTARRLIREARLQGDAILCFDGIFLGDPGHWKLFGQVLSEMDGDADAPIFLSPEKWDVRLDTRRRRRMELILPPATVKEQEILWAGFLAGVEFKEKIHIRRLASRYQLTPGAIALAVEEVKRMQDASALEMAEKDLFQAAQDQLAHKLGKDAIRIPVTYTMDDLILPGTQKQLLCNACNLVKYQHQVYAQWGFDSKVAYRKGLNMLFYGPPGTGKTMGAQAVASELGMVLYHVDMSGIRSKYMGESEKKLADIFEQGQKSQSILFLDGADALFGTRDEVTDTQDKYTTAGTAYLLRKIGEYQGVVILATNLLQDFDATLRERFQFIIEFPLPDASHRLKIWKRVFPEKIPFGEPLDFEYLAKQFAISGSQIKSIALASAFLSAGGQGKLSMPVILEAIRLEMEKAGKDMIGDDFGEYGNRMEG